MAQKEFVSEGTEKAASPFNLMPTELSAIGKQRTENCFNAQTELLDRLQEWNEQRFECMHPEASLASAFASKLTSTRWIPDAITAYQQWSGRHLEMLTEDGKHLFANVQKTWKRVCASSRMAGGPPGGTSGSAPG